jgi:small subunit ribosomal protein S6
MIMAEYELTLVTKTNLSPEELEKFVEELKKIISEKKGEVLNVESWGKKQLAYEIKKQRYGVYTLITFKVEDLGISKILDKKLKLSEPVLRSLTVRKTG